VLACFLFFASDVSGFGVAYQHFAVQPVKAIRTQPNLPIINAWDAFRRCVVSERVQRIFCLLLPSELGWELLPEKMEDSREFAEISRFDKLAAIFSPIM